MAAHISLNSMTDYTVAWIAALPIELAAAIAMFDERHGLPDDFEQAKQDPNVYSMGRIGSHNVVIASLASGIYGNTSATATALNLLAAFPCIRFGLLVGIGAGIPNRQHDIRLGDVVISQPGGTSGGVFQYDLGKILNGKWQRKGCLTPPPQILLKALTYFQSQHELGQSRLQEHLEDAFQRNPKWAKKFKYPEDESDRLFKSSYQHVEDTLNLDCSACAESGEIRRSLRDSNDIEIHCGIIGSGNALVKDAQIRDTIAAMERQCICLEMEAAGLMDNFPCLVVRGISDYADSHKNDSWQRYAAVAKGLLDGIVGDEISRTPRASDVLDTINAGVDCLNSKVDQMNIQMIGMHETMSREEGRKENDLCKAVLQTLYTCPYSERKDRNIQRVPGTCEWFTSHPKFRNWQDSGQSSLLWVSADPGCGKSVLAKHLIDNVLLNSNQKSVICYFFFKDDFLDQRSAAGAVSSLLHQLFSGRPDLVSQEVQEQFSLYGSKINESFSILWKMLLATIRNLPDEVIFVLDALDECRELDRSSLVQAIAGLDFESAARGNAKWLVTSRPYSDIRNDFREIKGRLPTIHLSGEGEQEVDKITGEILLVIKHHVKLISIENALIDEESTFLETQLTSIPHRTYLWVHLTMDVIKNIPGFSRGGVRQAVKELPHSVNEAYERILSRTSDERRARRILGIIVAALEPLSIDDMSIVMVISDQHHSHINLDEDLEQPLRMQMIIREVCGLFITIVDGKIYLLHQTAREFLVPLKKPGETNKPVSRLHWQHSFEQQRFDRFLAIATMRFLRLGGGSHSHPSFERYAMKSWVEHFQRAQFQSGDPLLQLFISRGRHLDEKFWYDVFEQELQLLGRASNDPKPAPGADLITLAAWMGHMPLIQVLIQLGVDASSSSTDDRGPLWWASCYGHYAVIKFLVNGDNDFHGDNEIQVSLEIAILKDHLDVFHFLWNSWSEVMRRKSLLTIIKGLNVDLLKEMTSQGLEWYTDWMRSLLWLARRPDFNPHMVKFVASKLAMRLVANGNFIVCSVDSTHHGIVSVELVELLLEAVSAGNANMIEFLLGEVRQRAVGFDYGVLPGSWRAILFASDSPVEIHSLVQLASYRLNADVLKLLLSLEAGQDWRKAKGRSSPLHLALYRGREHYEIRLEESAVDEDQNCVDKSILENGQHKYPEQYRIPLLSRSPDKSYEDAQKDVIKVLLVAGADPARSLIRKKDYERWINEGKTWIIEAFEEAGCDFNSEIHSTKRLQLPKFFQRFRS